MSCKHAAAVLFLVGGCGLPVWADIFAYTAEDGSVTLSNLPTDERYQLLVAGPRQEGASAPAPAVRPAGPAPLRKAAYDEVVAEVSRAYGLESALLHAVISVESRYNPKALSKKGAAGLMQLMPGTARRYGVTDAFDPAQNLRGGAGYLRDLLKLFDGDLSLALAAFNAGEQAVMKHGHRIPPYPETQAYVPRVLDFYRRYRAGS